MVVSLLLMPSLSLLAEASWCGGKRGPFSHDLALEQPSSLLRTISLGFPSSSFSDTKLWRKHLSFQKASSLGFKRKSIIVRTAPESEGKEASDSVLPPFEGEEAAAGAATAAAPSSIENLPLESKQQMLLEQKLRMKLAKKIRLKRKRLVRKRRMRKKGRWPPSKMKKNKNV